MKSLLVLSIAFAMAFSAQGFLISLDSIINTAQNTISTVQNTVNTAQFIGQILWDNAFGPSWDMFLTGGAEFVDNYFGTILNAVGKKREIEVRLQMSLVQSVFQQTAGELVTSFKSLLNQFVAEALQIAQGSILSIVFGQTTINDVFGVILGTFKSYIAEAVQTAISTFTTALHGLGPEASQVVTGLQLQLSSAGVMFQNELNQLSSIAINTVNGALAFLYNHFEDLITYYKSQVAALMDDINKILASSLIGLLFGITNVDAIFTNIIAKAKEYVAVALQYTVQYATEKLLSLYLQFLPMIQQVMSFIPPQFQLGNINMQTITDAAQQLFLAASGILLPNIPNFNNLIGLLTNP